MIGRRHAMMPELLQLLACPVCRDSRLGGLTPIQPKSERTDEGTCQEYE
jgi:uncharacterized protein YbaR (Trm112 family)